MKQLVHYIAESQLRASGPVPGDEIAIEIGSKYLLETFVLEREDNQILVQADEDLFAALKECKMLEEGIARYGAVGSSPGQGYTLGEYDLGGARRPHMIGKRKPEPAVKTDPESVGSWREFPDGTREEKTETGWKMVAGPKISRPRAVEEGQSMQRMLELAGVTNAAHNDPLAAKAADLAPVGAESDPETATTIDEGVMSAIDMDLRHIAKTARMDALVDAMRGEFGIQTQQYLQDMMDDVEHNLERRGMQDTNMQTKLGMLMDAVRELYAQEDLDEAEYQGRKVQLNKPMQGDVAKFKVYVKDPKTGNVKKVNFGDKTMRIKKSNPARRRSFRARHRCENPGPKTKARYWSCRKW